jgi:hypothetical protein
MSILAPTYISQLFNLQPIHDIEDEHFRPLYICAGGYIQALTYV